MMPDMKILHWAAAMALVFATCGCSGSDEDSGGSGGGSSSGPIELPAMGSLSADSGNGSFRFGAASAATQIEDQNTNTDWYVYTQPKADGGLGNGTFVGDAAKGYEKAIADVELLKAMHLDSYRFSIEWARIEPKRDQIDEAALQHYSDFIDALIAAGIKPMITVHHFSNPVWVDDPRDKDCANGPTDDNLCGLGHPQGGPMVIEEMAEHAKLLAERFGDRVDEWGTVNEPVNYLLAAYGIGYFPPGKQSILAENPCWSASSRWCGTTCRPTPRCTRRSRLRTRWMPTVTALRPASASRCPWANGSPRASTR